jgi:predicted enzyme related to lactoylglutathione lyase
MRRSERSCIDSCQKMVEATHADWRRRGLTVIQPPTRMGFGHTFTALDPDGHRLRVFASAAP